MCRPPPRASHYRAVTVCARRRAGQQCDSSPGGHSWRRAAPATHGRLHEGPRLHVVRDALDGVRGHGAQEGGLACAVAADQAVPPAQGQHQGRILHARSSLDGPRMSCRPGWPVPPAQGQHQRLRAHRSPDLPDPAACQATPASCAALPSTARDEWGTPARGGRSGAGCRGRLPSGRLALTGGGQARSTRCHCSPTSCVSLSAAPPAHAHLDELGPPVGDVKVLHVHVVRPCAAQVALDRGRCPRDGCPGPCLHTSCRSASGDNRSWSRCGSPCAGCSMEKACGRPRSHPGLCLQVSAHAAPGLVCQPCVRCGRCCGAGSRGPKVLRCQLQSEAFAPGAGTAA